MPGTGISIGRGTMPRDLLGYDPDRDRAVYSGIDDKGQTRQMFESRMWLGLAQFEGGPQQFHRRSTLMRRAALAVRVGQKAHARCDTGLCIAPACCLAEP